ncbi:hypothetical protein L226DRAFT_137151 [Lentinus tigrinus ALCF2SS1-7]|uniref:uncharacterized protein n=1 Tax=Lentinus tigrinus ALCF2SS1-7 TaxID=1328758 RepID=UPI00116636A2|nr:hypothetical protein L226DRAFT_137151 [Lentinus tigrinus ALCF2SS1-7]
MQLDGGRRCDPPADETRTRRNNVLRTRIVPPLSDITHWPGLRRELALLRKWPSRMAGVAQVARSGKKSTCCRFGVLQAVALRRSTFGSVCCVLCAGSGDAFCALRASSRMSLHACPRSMWQLSCSAGMIRMRYELNCGLDKLHTSARRFRLPLCLCSCVFSVSLYSDTAS